MWDSEGPYHTQNTPNRELNRFSRLCTTDKYALPHRTHIGGWAISHKGPTNESMKGHRPGHFPCEVACPASVFWLTGLQRYTKTRTDLLPCPCSFSDAIWPFNSCIFSTKTKRYHSHYYCSFCGGGNLLQTNRGLVSRIGQHSTGGPHGKQLVQLTWPRST